MRHQLRSALCAAAGFGALILGGLSPIAAASPFAPSPASVSGDAVVESRHVAESSGCGLAGCHPDITDQWSASAHHFSSFNNPFYTAAVRLLMAESGGGKKARWCAGCHDPALLFTGNFSEELDPESALATEGIGCMICHAVEEPTDLRGNGAYVLKAVDAVPAAASESEFLRKLGRTWLHIRSGPHKKMLLRPFHERAEFCMSCHKVSVPIEINDYRWRRGQNEYDAWHHSGISGNNSASFHFRRNPATCIQCHMPEVESKDEGNDDGHVASHRFAAANSALAAMQNDTAQLAAVEQNLTQGALRLWLGGLSVNDGPITTPHELRVVAGDELRAYVVVRNLNVGHHYPGGTIDSQESWLHVVVRDAAGKILLESGALEPDGEIAANSRVYRARLLDREGQLLEKRNVQHWHATAYALTIAPGTSDVARYRIRVDETLQLPLQLEARVRYRKFQPRFSNWVFEQNPDSLAFSIPIVDVASASWSLPEQRQLDALTAADRWNDLGVSLYLQKDRLRARNAFATAASLNPSRADLWLNQARVAWSDGDLSNAQRYLDEAAQRDAEHPTLWLLRARTLAALGQQAGAIDLYQRLLSEIPLDRGAWIELAETQFLAGLHREALKSYDHVLKIDPESLAAHNGRLVCLRALGEDFGAALAAVEHYKHSEIEASVAGRWLRENAAENRAAQAVWEFHEEGKTP